MCRYHYVFVSVSYIEYQFNKRFVHPLVITYVCSPCISAINGVYPIRWVVEVERRDRWRYPVEVEWAHIVIRVIVHLKTRVKCSQQNFVSRYKKKQEHQYDDRSKYNKYSALHYSFLIAKAQAYGVLQGMKTLRQRTTLQLRYRAFTTTVYVITNLRALNVFTTQRCYSSINGLIFLTVISRGVRDKKSSFS